MEIKDIFLVVVAANIISFFLILYALFIAPTLLIGSLILINIVLSLLVYFEGKEKYCKEEKR